MVTSAEPRGACPMWNRTRLRPVPLIILALMAFSAAGAGDKTYDAVRAAKYANFDGPCVAPDCFRNPVIVAPCPQ
jgi:hypothetical protein